MIAPSTGRMAATAASAARRALVTSSARMMRFPPPTPSTIPKRSSTRNSPSITGIRQYRRPPSTLLACQPSPKYRNRPPTVTSSPPLRPLKHAVVGQVSTVWPMRSTSRLARLSASIANSSAEIPGRPSGVSAASSSRSIPASHLQPMTDVAKPVSERAA